MLKRLLMLTKEATKRIHSLLSIRPMLLKRATFTELRCFHSESSYHDAADAALNKIQDTLDFYFEDNPQLTSNPDINYSSGVLTIGLPHGTWVLNKQTPVSYFT